MNTNIGYLFYKSYYKNLSYVWKANDARFIAQFDGASVNEKLFKQRLSHNLSQELEPYTIGLTNTKIPLRTIYPGLLSGSGYQHEILANEKKSNNDPYVKDELKLGFYFDYATGLPALMGSSVKGVLRSAFKQHGYIIELLDELLKVNEVWNNALIDKMKILELLEQHIFEITDNRSIYERDVFFDAFPVTSENRQNIFLSNDYITPHNSPIKSPNPVQFLKVLPQVTYEFNFQLVATEILLDNEHKIAFSKAEKKQLFQTILLDFGIGAKTNVGYGQFELDERAANLIEEAERKLEIEIEVANDLDKSKKIIKEGKRIEKERREANEKRFKEEEKEMKANGLKNILATLSDFNRGKEFIIRYEKISLIESQEDVIVNFIKNVLVEVKQGKSSVKKPWRKMGTGNWKKVVSWLGEEKAIQLFENHYKK